MDIEDTNYPLVSIIIITYNSSQFVIETLESTKSQTYQNIELIISDDCSTDNTIDICTKWIRENKEYFKRTEIINSNINTGIPANVNRGAKIAKGKWLKFIAGDDVLLPHCIEFFIGKTYDNPNFFIASSNVEYIDVQSKSIDSFDPELDKLRIFFSTLSTERQHKEYARLPIFLNSPTFFINKDLLKKMDWFDESFQIYDDMPLIYKSLGNGFRVYFFKEKTVKYRISNNSISQTLDKSSDKKNKEQILCFEKYRRKLLNKYNIIDQSVLFEFWLQHHFKGIFGRKFISVFNKVSLYYWYKKMIILLINV